jgi:hypothetical protein
VVAAGVVVWTTAASPVVMTVVLASSVSVVVVVAVAFALVISVPFGWVTDFALVAVVFAAFSILVAIFKLPFGIGWYRCIITTWWEMYTIFA